MKDFGINDDLVETNSFYTYALSAAAISFLLSKFIIIFKRQHIEFNLTLMFF